MTAMAQPGAAVRLAELVAALSLGIDLGFGQPMEHVLRQCLIAMRLAGRMGLDDDARSAVYYTSLLVNVGCHSDAHEQAKWFGDDIELKSHKYDYDQKSLVAAAASFRRLGQGHPPIHRFRIGLEFALSGFRDLDGMIAQHADIACSLAAELGLPDEVQNAISASYERWDGRGWPGELRGDSVPLASRLAQLAEYMEVAHRVGGDDAAVAMARDPLRLLIRDEVAGARDGNQGCARARLERGPFLSGEPAIALLRVHNPSWYASVAESSPANCNDRDTSGRHANHAALFAGRSCGSRRAAQHGDRRIAALASSPCPSSSASLLMAGFPADHRARRWRGKSPARP